MNYNDLSPKGAAFIREHEGFVSRWYLDPGGVPTIGTGFTWRSAAFREWWAQNRPGQEFARGATMTRAEAEAVLIYVAQKEYGKAVNDFLGGKRPQHVFDAATSTTFNAGPGALAWKWAEAMKAGDYPLAAKRLKTTATTQNGKTLAGLVRRRREEALLMEQGIYTGVAEIKVDATDAAPDDGIWERGERGPEVAAIIRDLHILGYYDGVLDDVFGYGTEAAVLEFQRDKSLTVDGKVGAQTLAALARARAAAIIPIYRPRLKDARVHELLSKHVPGSHGVRILFVRGFFGRMGKTDGNDRDIYDDAAFVVSPEGVAAFNANADPSIFRKGIASIKAPQVIVYRPGLHGYSRPGGPYPAFRQDENCWVERDDAPDEFGMFHVNLHRGGDGSTSSAGCLTIPPHQWDEFRDLVNRLLAKHDQQTFPVCLIDHEEPSVMDRPVDVTPKEVGLVGLVALLAALVGEIISGIRWAYEYIGGLF